MIIGVTSRFHSKPLPLRKDEFSELEWQRMEYDEIIAGFQSLKAPDFDPMNINARGLERLKELTDALMGISERERAIPELFGVMERLPDAHLGSPGPLVHTLEALKGYENELIRSVRRSPSLLSVWMVNRILNTDLPSDLRQSYMAVLDEAAARPDVSKAVREDARDFVELQTRNPEKSSNC